MNLIVRALNSLPHVLSNGPVPQISRRDSSARRSTAPKGDLSPSEVAKLYFRSDLASSILRSNFWTGRTMC